MAKSNLISLAADSAEVIFDQILNDGLVKEIPIVNSIANVLAVGNSVRDTLFARKLARFLNSINSVSEEDYAKIRSFAVSTESDEISEKILNVIDSTSEISKADIIASVFLGYIERELSSSEFNTVLEVIEKSYTKDLNSFLTNKFLLKTRKDMKKLQRNGIANLVNTPLIERKDIHPLTTRQHSDPFSNSEEYQESYRITKLGNNFRHAYYQGQRMREEHS